jgi:nucleoside-diphosphate-sugar epimerase
MSPANQAILVTGATGLQGGATARHLLAGGWPVRALVGIHTLWGPPNSPARALSSS